MLTLDEDILRLLLEYVPLTALDTINGVHPIFYEAWMKSRYASVTLIKRDKELKRLLLHLPQSYVARHVKSVSIRPWLVSPRTKSPRSITELVAIRCMKVLDPDYTKKAAEKRLQKRLAKDIVRVTAAFEAMSDVEEYTIQWDDNAGYHPEFYRAFLAPPLIGWSAHLVKLTICVPPSMINSLVRVRLPHLEAFAFQFSTDNLPSKEIAIIYDGFVVFVNNLKDSLTSLTFSSTHMSQNLDLSRIFRLMGSFPSLRKVALSIPFDGGHLEDPSSFVRFLLKHSGSLKELSVLTSRCTPRHKPGDSEQANWIQLILASIHRPFPLLRGVEIALRPLRAPLETLFGFLDMHSATLESVSLADRLLELDELERLFGPPPAIAEGIQELHVKVDALSVVFLARVASLFPNLIKLRLECARFERGRSRIVLGSRGTAADFFTDLSDQQHIKNWSLQYLAIGPAEYPQVKKILCDLQHCLPRLTVSHFNS